MSEAATLQEIRLGLGRIEGLRMFRNNIGSLRDITGRVVSFGLHPGSSDLIGWRSVTVTPAMVGQRLALFAAVEVKAPGGKHPVTPEQARFLALLTAAGGVGGVARNTAQALHVLGLAQHD